MNIDITFSGEMVDLVSMDPWIFRHGVDAVKENIFDPV